MKTQVASGDLKRAFTLLAPFITASTLPVLSYIHVEAADQQLQLFASNLEAGLAVSIPATIESIGSILLPYSTAFDFLKVSSSGPVSINSTVLGRVDLKVGPAKTSLKVLSTEEYPGLPPPPDTDGVSLSTCAWSRVIRSVAFAASKDKARPNLQAICFASEGKQINLVATDGFRLSVQCLGLGAELRQRKLLVNAETLAKFAKLFDEKDDRPMKMLIPTDSGRVFFQREDLLFFAQANQTSFPDGRDSYQPSSLCTG